MATYEDNEGYQALKRAVGMTQAELVDMAKDSGLRGRGGAGFPTGLKWSFLPPPDGGPRYLVVNADESEPGTCKDIPLMMAAPHFLIEGVAITSFAIGCNHAFIYLRGEVVHVYRRLLHAVEEAYAAGYLGKNILGTGFDLDVTVHAGRRRLHLRRGDRAPRLARGSSRPAPPEAAVPRRGRPLRASHGRQQRREHRLDPADPVARRGLVQGHGQRQVHRVRDLQPVRTRPPAGPVRGAAGDHPARAARHGRRDARPAAQAEVLDPGRLLDAVVHRRPPRRAPRLRVGGRGGVDARHPGPADLRRHHLRGARDRALDRLLQARVLRQVHARAGKAPGGWPRSSSGSSTARATRRTSRSSSTSATTSSAAPSAPSATGRRRRSRAASSTSATSTSSTCGSVGARSTVTPRRCSPLGRPVARPR